MLMVMRITLFLWMCRLCRASREMAHPLLDGLLTFRRIKVVEMVTGQDFHCQVRICSATQALHTRLSNHSIICFPEEDVQLFIQHLMGDTVEKLLLILIELVYARQD